MFAWTRFTKTALVVIGFLFGVVLSCDEVQRHKTLTFFFDGVPLLGGDDVNEPNMADDEAETARDIGPVTRLHEPYRTCTKCHDTSKRPKGRIPIMVKDPPELCFDCHPNSDYSNSGGYVHGPVAAADCLICHEHHRSMNDHLLDEPVPELCYRCHEERDIELIPDHSTETASECLNCHVGHASPIKGLLRKDAATNPNEG